MQAPWIRTSQLICVVSSAFSLGLYILPFMGGRLDAGGLAAFIGFSASFVVFSALLLHGFWKTK